MIDKENTRSIEEIQSELSEVEGTRESLRATTPVKRVAHVLLALIFGVMFGGVGWLVLALGADLLSLGIKASSPLSFVAFLTTTFLFSWLFHRVLFIPKEGAFQEYSERYNEGQDLRRELETARKRESAALEARATAQREEYGGVLSIAQSSVGGELNVVEQVAGSMSVADEVAFDFEHSESSESVDASIVTDKKVR